MICECGNNKCESKGPSNLFEELTKSLKDCHGLGVVEVPHEIVIKVLCEKIESRMEKMAEKIFDFLVVDEGE